MALEQEAEDGISLVTSALWDLGIDPVEDRLHELLELETEWITQDGVAQDKGLREKDVYMAWSRVLNQLMERWHEAEKRRASDLPTVSLDDVPYFSCFIS